MNLTKLLQYLSVVSTVTGAIGASNSIPGVSPAAGGTIIGISLAVWKISVLAGDALAKKQAVAVTVQTDEGPATLKVPPAQLTTPPASP